MGCKHSFHSCHVLLMIGLLSLKFHDSLINISKWNRDQLHCSTHIPLRAPSYISILKWKNNLLAIYFSRGMTLLPFLYVRWRGRVGLLRRAWRIIILCTFLTVLQGEANLFFLRKERRKKSVYRQPYVDKQT